MGSGGKGPAQLTAMAIAQYRQAYIFAYNQENYMTAAAYVQLMYRALPKPAHVNIKEMPKQYKDGKALVQDTKKNFAFLELKPWIDETLPEVEHALSEYIDNFYKTNPKMANLY